MRTTRLLPVALFVFALAACKKDTPKAEDPPPAPVAKGEPAPGGGAPTDPAKPADPPADPVKPADPPAVPAGDWKPFTSTAGRYTVTFPGTPMEQSQDTDSEVGKLTVHFAAVDKGDAAYMVGYNDLPKEADLTPKRVLDGQRDGTIKTFPNAKIIEEKEITMDGNPGRSLTFEAPSLNATHRSRTFLVGNRVYTVIALAVGDGKPDVAATFLDSFKLAAK